MAIKRTRRRERTPKTVYDVLDQVRTRPGMFLGDVSVTALLAFTSGLSWSQLSPGQPSFWEFNRWASAMIDGTTGTWTLMERRLGPEATLGKFFHYLERYRSCREVALARATGPFVSNTVSISATGTRSVMPPPESIVVGQFHPSRVFYVLTKRSTESEREGGFFRSKAEAMRYAEKSWAFPHNRWRLLRSRG